MPITPHSLAKSLAEDAEQTALFAWFAWQFSHCPELRLAFAIPNGGARGNDPRTAMIRGAKLKAQGVKPGVPDVFIPVPQWTGVRWAAGLFIELKKIKGGNTKDPHQLQWAIDLKQQGYSHALCRGWEAARDVVMEYFGKDRPWVHLEP